MTLLNLLFLSCAFFKRKLLQFRQKRINALHEGRVIQKGLLIFRSVQLVLFKEQKLLIAHAVQCGHFCRDRFKNRLAFLRLARLHLEALDFPLVAQTEGVLLRPLPFIIDTFAFRCIISSWMQLIWNVFCL